MHSANTGPICRRGAMPTPRGQSSEQSTATESHTGSDSTSLEEPANPARVVDDFPWLLPV